MRAAGFGRYGRKSRWHLIGFLLWLAASPLAAQEGPVAATLPREGEKPHSCTSPDGVGPEMLLIEAGRFMMGSPNDEPRRSEAEGPLHEVTIQHPFAIGRCEVTVAQFGRFVEETGYRTDAERGGGCRVWNEVATEEGPRSSAHWRSPGFAQTGEHPVVCVSWRDARAYTNWLSARTGAQYRLPSEAEWEYAVRAGTTTPFSIGDCITTDQANYNGTFDYNDCGGGEGAFREATVVAGSLKANPWGLREVHGNAMEWGQDCLHGGYQGAPTGGGPWLESGGGDCAWRVVRGGGFGYPPKSNRSASREWYPAGNAFNDLGFRVARTL